MLQPKTSIIRHTSIYFFGDVLRHSVSLIMLPIYTRYLTPGDYGVVELLSMTIDLATIIFGARIAQAIFRYYCTATTDEEKMKVIGSALFLAFLLNFIGASVVTVFSGHLSQAIFSEPTYGHFIALLSIAMALAPFTEIPLTYLRAQQNAWGYFTFSTLKLIIQLSLNIYLVVYLEMHVAGVIYSALITNIMMALILMAYTLLKSSLRISITTCKTLFSFSLPIKLAAIGSFYMTYGDRYILNMYTDLTQVGIYSLGYKFAFIYTILFWDTFEKTWDAEKYSIKEQPNARQIYQRVFLFMSLVLILFGLGMSLFTKDLLKIMSAPAFLDAYKVVPIIIGAYVFQSWTRYCNLGLLLNNKTADIAYAEAIASIVITISYFTLIPAFGIYGAAWATLIGFSARFYWVNKKAKELYDMDLPWFKIGSTALLATLVFILSLGLPDDIFISAIARMTLLITFITILFLLPILSTDEKEMIRAAIPRNMAELRKGIFSRVK